MCPFPTPVWSGRPRPLPLLLFLDFSHDATNDRIRLWPRDNQIVTIAKPKNSRPRRNSVRRRLLEKLVEPPELWRWSSFHANSTGEAGPVAVNACQVLKMKLRRQPHRDKTSAADCIGAPLLKKREKWRTPGYYGSSFEDGARTPTGED